MANEGLYYYTKHEIDELISGGSSGTNIFMKKSTYDSNNNGIVDNAEKVNGHTVLKDVPANAQFTDTTYTAGTGIVINNGVISCTLAPLPAGTKFQGSDSELYNFLQGCDLSAMAQTTDFSYMFYSCENLTKVPLFDTSNGTRVDYMFGYCTSLTSVPLFDTSNATSFSNMFTHCESLTSAPSLDTSKATDIQRMFWRCGALISAPSLDTSKVLDAGAMFNGCSSLVNVPQYDFSKVTSFGSSGILVHDNEIFYGCTSLSNESLNNILASMAGATSYSGTKTLKFLGLTQAQATTCQSLSNYAAFTAAGWTTGY